MRLAWLRSYRQHWLRSGRRPLSSAAPTQLPIHEQIQAKAASSAQIGQTAAGPRRIRPRRSALYMPGSRRRALDKARTLPADCIIMDLEDAVAPDAKDLARAQVVEEIQAGGYGNREVVVRVNGVNTQWFEEDVCAAAKSGADAVLLPKTESAGDISRLQDLLVKHGAPVTQEIWCMIETPLGVLSVKEMCSEMELRERQGRFRRGTARPSLTTICMGFADLGKELHAPHVPGRLNIMTSAQLCVLAARAYGLMILDGVHLGLDDMAEFEAECLQGVHLGMDGKTLIHPKQIAAANLLFAPSESEVSACRRMIEAHAEAVSRGDGVFVMDGRLVENLHVANAQRIVQLADAIKARGSNSTEA